MSSDEQKPAQQTIVVNSSFIGQVEEVKTGLGLEALGRTSRNVLGSKQCR